jgi:hypothetical protein
MALDPRIILGGVANTHPTLLNDPMDLAVKASQNRLVQRHIQALDTEDARTNKLAMLAQSAVKNGVYDPELHKSLLNQAGEIEKAQTVQKSQNDSLQEQRLQAQQKIEGEIKKVEYLSNTAQGVHDQASLDAFRKHANEIVPGSIDGLPTVYADGVMDPILAQAATHQQNMTAQLAKDQLDWQKQHGNDTLQVQREVQQQSALNSKANFDETKRYHDLQTGAAQGANNVQSNQNMFQNEQKLNADHQAESKNFVGVRDAYARLREALPEAHTHSPAALAAGTMYMKLLDPGSVVRESELGMALNATGVWDKALNYANTLANGGTLTESQVKEFSSMSRKLYDAAEKNQNSLNDQYKKRATEYGMNPDHVITDYGHQIHEQDALDQMTPEGRAAYLKATGGE